MGLGHSLAGELQKHTFKIGPELSYIEYKEPSLMSEKGVMYGIAGSYAYHRNFMLKVDGRFSYGQIDYDGQLNDGTSYTIDGIDNYILEFRGLGGYDFSVFTSSTITPYLGFGYRYLNDDLSFDPAGYERESNYIYIPIGVEVITPLKNNWSIGAMLEYDYFLLGKQISHLSDVNPGYNDPENRQDKGYGLRGSVELQKKVKKVAFAIEPFIRYWNIKQSDNSDVTYYGTKVGYGYEPKNNSTEIGVKLSAKL